MAISLSSADHDKMEVLLDGILEAVASEDVTAKEARNAIAHILTAAAIGNEGELRGWLDDPGVLQEWKDQAERLRT